jgi:hypothetical protein
MRARALVIAWQCGIRITNRGIAVSDDYGRGNPQVTYCADDICIDGYRVPACRSIVRHNDKADSLQRQVAPVASGA